MSRIIVIMFFIIVSVSGLWSLLISPYIPSFHDQYQAERVYAMTKAIAFGQFPVRYVDDLGFGLGYPLFNFYAPLPYYIGSIFVLTGFSLVMSTKIMIVIGFIGSFASMYFVVSRYLNNKVALLAAILYTLAPYHAVQLYVRGSIGEIYAYALLPFLFAIIFEFVKSTSPKINKVYIVAMALLMVSHTVSVYMSLLYIATAVMVIFSIEVIKNKSNNDKKIQLLLLAKKVMAYLLIPILLSAFFLIPAFLELSSTRLSIESGNEVEYSRHFVSLSQLWSSPWGYGGSESEADGMSFMIGKTSILLALFAFIYIIIRHKSFSEIVPINALVVLISTIIITTFLMLKESYLIWQTIPYSQLIQFPWRWISFTNVAISILGAISIIILEKQIPKKYFNILSVILIALITYSLISPITISSLPQNKFFRAQSYYQKDDIEITDKAHLNGEVSKVSNEFLYKDVDLTNIYSGTESIYCTTLCQIRNEITTPDSVSFSANMYSTGYITTNKANFPGMKLFVNGVQQNFESEKGIVKILLPARGKYEINLQLFDTPIRAISNVISFTTIMALLITWQIRDIININGRKSG